MNLRLIFPLLAIMAATIGLTGCVEDDIYMSSTAYAPTDVYYSNVGPYDGYRSHHHRREVRVVTQTPPAPVVVREYHSSSFGHFRDRVRSSQTPPAPPMDAPSVSRVSQTPPAPPESTSAAYATPAAPPEDMVASAPNQAAYGTPAAPSE